jgi:hypothetical protein
MSYLTSWDVNTFLCLVYWGIPEDVVKRMTRVVKKTHEEFSLEGARSYWLKNTPTLVKMEPSVHRGVPVPRFKFCVPNVSRQSEIREFWNKRFKNIAEFKTEWRLRSIEERQKKVIDWCKFGDEQEQQRQQLRFRIFTEYSYMNSKYTKNLWQSWEAWSHCEHPPQIMGWDTVRPQPRDRRNYISKWYEGIHPGRFFLFYRENLIIKERNRGVPRGPCEDGYRFPKIPIYDWGPYEQLIDDLRCIDGPGLGESGPKVEHIDDLFLD